MNRVILGGRLLGPPRIVPIPAEASLAHLRLQVSRPGGNAPSERLFDAIDCYAAREVAIILATWGSAPLWLNLEGRLITALFPHEHGETASTCCVWVERLYALDLPAALEAA